MWFHHFFQAKYWVLAILLVSSAWAQGLLIPPHAGYRPSFTGPEYGSLESVSTPDSGGYVTCLVRNLTGTPCNITGVTVFTGTDTIHDAEWMAWPLALPPAGSPGNPWSWITLKGISHPFHPGDTFSFVVHTDIGIQSGRIPLTCTPSPLAISHVVAGKDDKGLDIFLRNDHGSEIILDTLILNQWTWSSFGTGGIRITGGSASILPGSFIIVHVLEDSLFYETMPIHLQVHWKESLGVGNGWTVSGTRLVGPEPVLGTWHSSGMDPDREYGRKRLRTLSLGAMQGPGNNGLCSIGFQEYYIKTIREPAFGTGASPDSAVAAPVVRMLRDSAWMQCWSIDDEPDLNGKPVRDELLKNYTYLLNDPGTPSFVNLAVQHKFNRYAWFADIVAQDHYSAADAPNIIPNTWIPFIGREGKLDESVEYMQVLKRNAEPRRVMAWSQLNSGVWSSRPQPHSVDHQFWGQVMAGAKGILWFTAQSDLPEDAPLLWSRSQEISWQWTSIRELLMHSEPFDSVSCSTSLARGGLLAGEEAAVLIILNQSADFTFNTGSLTWTSTMDTIAYSCTFRLPDWLTSTNIRMLTADGLIPQPSPVSLGGGRYQFSPALDLKDRSHVFLIGVADTAPPKTPGFARIPEYIDLANYTISWPVARDNRGIAGYEISWNGVVADTVNGPVFEVIDGNFNCVTGNWSIRAFDLDGNISSPTYLPITISIPDPVVLNHPADIGLVQGVDTFFTVAATGDGISYQWQMGNGGSWTNLTETIPYSGTTTDTLWIQDTPDSLDGTTFRCVVSNPCLASDTSNAASLTVYVGITDYALSGWTLYPNPSTGNISISGPYGQCAELIVLNTTGISVVHQTVCPGENLDIRELPTGIYVAEIHQGGQLQRIRFQLLR